MILPVPEVTFLRLAWAFFAIVLIGLPSLAASATWGRIKDQYRWPAWAGSPPFEELFRYPSSRRWNAGVEIIRSAEEFQSLWNDLGRRDQPPLVNFQERMVVVYFLGGRPMSGYSVRIEGIEIRNGLMHVRALETAPGIGCGGGLVATAPWTAITTVRLPGGAEVSVAREAPPCLP